MDLQELPLICPIAFWLFYKIHLTLWEEQYDMKCIQQDSKEF